MRRNWGQWRHGLSGCCVDEAGNKNQRSNYAITPRAPQEIGWAITHK